MVPTIEQLCDMLQRASAAGKNAADQRFQELLSRSKDGRVDRPYDEPGGAHLILKIDGRSKLGKTLKSCRIPIDGYGFEQVKQYGGFIVSLPRMTDRQETCLHVAANQAAARVLEKELGVKSHISPYHT
jgi:hypothetical protein